MIAVHAVVGIITIIVGVWLLIWNGIRLAKRWTSKKSYYRWFVSLIDIQILLGIITYIIHPKGGAWLLHPLFMIVAAGVAHVYTKDSRRLTLQVGGYVVVLVLLLLGVWLGRVYA